MFHIPRCLLLHLIIFFTSCYGFSAISAWISSFFTHIITFPSIGVSTFPTAFHLHWFSIVVFAQWHFTPLPFYFCRSFFTLYSPPPLPGAVILLEVCGYGRCRRRSLMAGNVGCMLWIRRIFASTLMAPTSLMLLGYLRRDSWGCLMWFVLVMLLMLIYLVWTPLLCFLESILLSPRLPKRYGWFCWFYFWSVYVLRSCWYWSFKPVLHFHCFSVCGKCIWSFGSSLIHVSCLCRRGYYNAFENFNLLFTFIRLWLFS